MQFLNALTPLQWAIAAAVPIGVVALYFLKLRRKPVQVPSTYLWQKSIEDLHVNSLFQRLRRNLLLFLQLLILALALLALARPSWMGTERGGLMHVILIDNSASMAATDVNPSRLEWAKVQARTEVIDKMARDDRAMIIAFNDSARVVASYTSNRQVLRERLASIPQTQRRTNPRDALRVAAGLANPQKFFELPGETEPSETAQLHIFSDGRFPNVQDFSLGSLKPHFYAVGESGANAGIATMSIRRNEEHPDELQVFASLQNFSQSPLPVRSELYVDGDLRDAQERRLEPGGSQDVAFELEHLEEGVVELRLEVDDHLKTDNEAWTVIGRGRRGKVLAVSPGNNRWLELAVKTEAAQQISEVDIIRPDALASEEYRQKADGGYYDLIIYDRCAPETMPQSNTLFFGAIPKLPSLGEVKKLEDLLVAEVKEANPLFRFVNMENVYVMESLLPELPTGTEVLLESGEGPLAFLLTREGFADCVIGFGILRNTSEGPKLNTDWFARYSFPMFIFNALRVLGNVQDAISDKPILPGETVALRSNPSATKLVVKDPTGKLHREDDTEGGLKRTPQGMFLFNRTDWVGVYEFSDSERVQQRFAANLFDVTESDIVPRRELHIGHSSVEARSQVNRARKELWRWMIFLALGVLLTEWYVYNRRVYI